MERFLSIDLLRGLAIVLMIQVHFTDNLSARSADSSWLYDASAVLGALAAPLFAFLSGVSYCLWVRKREAERAKDRAITRTTLKRGAFLFLLGIVFNFCIWLPEETFNWDILTLLGTALLLLAFARKLPMPVLGLICAVVIALGPVLRTVGDYTEYWENYEYVYDFTARDIAFGFLGNGYFPVFPWLAVPLAGFLAGDAIFLRRKPNRRRVVAVATALMALALFGIALANSDAPALVKSYADGLSEFPASTCYVVGMLGAMPLALLFLHRRIDRTPAPDSAIIRSLRRFSAFSLTIYFAHHAVILWPLWLYGGAKGHSDSTVYWRNAMTTPPAFALALLFLAACHFAMLGLEKRHRFALESLMRRVCG